MSVMARRRNLFISYQLGKPDVSTSESKVTRDATFTKKKKHITSLRISIATHMTYDIPSQTFICQIK